MRLSLLLVPMVLAGCVDRYQITITDMTITNDADTSGTPEIEVYLFDQDDELIACAGSQQGLLNVDSANVVYELDARLIDDDHDRDIAIDGGLLRFEVWEDDDDPVCPKYPNPQGNDFLGASEAMTISRWLDFKGDMQFGEVSLFKVELR
jgi:hypothetical protein